MAIKVAPETFTFPEVAAPGTPDTGYVHIYAKSDGKMYRKDDAGVETELGSSTAAPADATYIVQTANGTLTNEQVLGSLATGVVKVTTTTGVLSSVAAPSGAIVGDTDSQTLANKILSQLHLLIGGFKAIFTHAFTADRTITLPGDADVTLVGLATTQTLTNKTLTAPTIADFTNMAHDHVDADDGGQLTDAALSAAVGIAKGGTGQTTQTAAFDALAPTTTKGDIIVSNGTDNIRLAVGATNGHVLQVDSAEASGVKWAASAGATAPQIIINGFTLKWLANDKILVSGGTVAHGTTLLNKTVGTVLTMGTAGDWIDGASGEAASAFASVYINASGTLKLHDTLPNNSSSVAATFVANMRVNQAGWNGTAGLGLNATSVVYDTDTGEGSITAGMLLGIYSDSVFTTGRGKGSAATATLDDMSFALITAIDTGTNTLTLETGHQIAINDNDYLIVIENAPVVYRDESGTVWRWIGAMYNNASSNLDSNRIHNRAFYQANEGADYTTTSSSFGNIDGTSFNHDLILTEIADVITSLAGSAEHSSTSARTYFGMLADGSQLVADDGLTFFINPDAGGANREVMVSLEKPVTALLPGTHNFKPQWKTSASTATMHAGAGSASNDSHAEFTAYILR